MSRLIGARASPAPSHGRQISSGFADTPWLAGLKAQGWRGADGMDDGPTPPSLIRAGLYLGSAASVSHADRLGITHILSVGPRLSDGQTASCTVKHVEVDDDEEANLLQHLGACCSFIEEAIDDEEGKVLVHCQAGMSRSAAVVVAYLMHSEGQGVQDALESILPTHPSACPNDGFMAQLQLFCEMGCRIKPSNEAYKRFNLQQVGKRWEQEGYVDEEELEDVSNTAQANGRLEGEAYRCRKCRTLLATHLNAVTVEEGPGQTGFPFSKRAQHKGPPPSTEPSSLFLEPLRWMQDVIHQQSGKLYCPKCKERLGTFNWSGIQSTSGSWVTPGFQIHLSKLDVLSPSLDTHLQSFIRHPQGSGPTRLAVAPAGQEVGRIAPSKARFSFLIFDCDGVLVDSERASCLALHQAMLELTGLDIPQNFPEDFYPVFGMDVRSCCQYYHNSMGGAFEVEAVATEMVGVKERIFKEMTSGGIAGFPFVRELVEHAKARAIPVGVGSSGSPEKIHHNLSSAGLLDLFPSDLVVSAQMVAKGKPAPDVYNEVMRRMGCTDASRAIVIEDAVNGLLAAKAAGAFSIGITNTVSRESLEPHADLVVDSMEEIKQLLQ